MPSVGFGAIRLSTVRTTRLILFLTSYFFYSQLRTRVFRTYVTASPANDTRGHVVSTSVTVPSLQTLGEPLSSVQGNPPYWRTMCTS
jgi:hypothetical protein